MAVIPDVTPLTEVMSFGDCTRSVRLAHMQQRPPAPDP